MIEKDMLTTEEILQIIGFTAPMLTSFFCGVLMVLSGWRDKKADSRKLSLRMAGAFLAATLTWLSLGLFVLSPRVFGEVHAVVYWLALMCQVLIYHNVFRLTTVRRNEGFPFIHYIIPFVLCLTLAVWSLFVPADIRLAIIERREFPSSYQMYAAFFTSKVPVFLLYNLFYSFRGLRRIRRYRKAVADYSADHQRSSVRWLYSLFIITLATLPLTLGLLIPVVFIRSLAALLPVLLTMLQDILFAYNLFAVNYVLMFPAVSKEGASGSADTSPEDDKTEADGAEANKLDREKFEHYVWEHKPYLNPGLRITDIIYPLKTNRTYLSAFINREYGFNFSQFINYCRLQEYEQLCKDPDNAGRSILELIQASGFNNYRNYHRARKMLAERQGGQG